MTTLNLDNIDLGSFGVTDEQPSAVDVVGQQRQKKLSATMNEALKVNPDQQAHVNKLSRESGVPVDAVAIDPVDIEHGLKLQNIDIKSLSENTPVTARYFNNFDNASIAHDDVGVLSTIESHLGSFNKGWLGQVVGATTQGVGRVLDTGGRFTARGLDLILPEAADDILFETPDTPDFIKMLNRLDPAEGLQNVGQSVRDFADTLTPENTRGFSHDVSAGLGQVVGQIATAIYSVPASTAALFAQGVNIQGDAQAATGTEGQSVSSDLGLLAGGAVTTVTERIAIDKLLDRVPPKIKNKLLRNIADLSIAGGVEAAQEVIEGVAQNLIELYTSNPDAEIIEGLENEAAVAGTVGVIIRALINTALPGKVGASAVQEQDRARKSDLEQTTIDQINEQSETSKLRERDNDAFMQFIEEADGDANTTLFVDGVQTRLYLADNQGQIESDPALQMLAEKVNEAAALGGDLAIPVSEFAGVLAGTEHFTNLRDFMTLSEETQAPFRQEQTQAETEGYIAQLVNEAQQSSSQYVESQDIFDSVRDQLIDTGVVNAQNASVMAQIVPAWAAVQAERNNVGVREVYENSGLVIEGPQTGELSRLTASDETLGTTVNQPVDIDPEQIEQRLNQLPIDRRASDAPVDQDRRQGDRRRDSARREKIAKMTPEEQYAAIYQHELTGLNNRRAFEEDIEDADVVVSIDVDSLKATNDNLGHGAGDLLLKTVAQVLHSTTDGRAYHISGDEFFVLGDNQQDIEAQLRDAQEQLATATVTSDKGTLTGPAFSFGSGVDKKSADEAMEAGKEVREEQGLRVGRGELPAGMKLNEVLKQDKKGVAQGFYDPANSVIRLTESSDLSTFLHEFAHFMYEMELTTERATPDSVNSISSIHNWFKRNADDVAREASESKVKVSPRHVEQYLDEGTTGDVGRDKAIRRAVHEQFARGFETYVMEGKAPSNELRNAFRTFARWLTQVYRAVRGNLRVNLDNEMREVFDRLLATEEQINAAEARAQYQPMFTDAAMAGMTEEEFQKYQEHNAKVKDVQTETLREKLIKEFTRQTKAWWKEEKSDLVDEQLETLRGERVYRAREVLKNGDMKLDRATVKEMIGEERTDRRGQTSTRIPETLNGMTVTGARGVHPDEAAAFFGYDSGSEMLTDMAGSMSIKQRAEANAEEQMIDRYGDMLHDGTIEAQADEAVQNEARGELLLEELKALRRRAVNAPVIDRMTVKQMAEENIAKLSFRQIHPGKYRKAEIRAAQEAATALAAGDADQAARAKARQILNYYLGMAATKARADTVKIVDRMARYNKKSVREEIQKAENGYWEQIVKILDRFEFRKAASLKAVDQQNQDVNTWMKERMETDGDALVLSSTVMNELFTTHWKNVTYNDLQGINDSVKNIEHVARYSNRMTLLDEEMRYKSLRDSWVDHIEQQDATHTRKDTADIFEDVRRRGFSDSVKRWNSQLTKIPFLASWLDGGERVGMSHQILMQRVTEALDDKLKLMDEVATPVFKLVKSRSKEDVKRHLRKIYIPEIDAHITGEQVLSVALNTGNESNLRKLLLGEDWANPDNDAEISFNNPKLQAILKHMTKSDWDMVQTIWDQMELLYPQLAEVHRRTTGLAPPKVVATPINNEFGEFRGGYYPIKYSPRRSHKAAKNAEKAEAEVESMFNNTASIHASVNTGATNERTKFYDRINLNLSVVPEHFNETIHYITHHDAIRQINKLIQDPAVANAITGVMGESEYNNLKPWLNDVAKDGRGAPIKSYIDEAFQRLRFGVTLGVMGFKASTGIMQIFGLLTTAAEVGPGATVKAVMNTVGRSHYLKAVRKIFGSVDDIQSNWEFANERSNVLNHRAETMDRELRNARERLAGRHGVVAGGQELSMKHIILIQTYMVDLPTWIAAYDSKLAETGSETTAAQYGDWAVENLQGSGATKDMATLMRSQTKLQSTFTMFMTFFSSLGNLSRDLVRGSRSGLYSPTNTAAKAMFLFTLPVFLEMLMRGEFDEPEDGEDERLQEFATKTVLYPLTSVPLLRDAVGGLVGDYGYNMTPVSSVVEKGIQGLKQSERLFTDEEITKSAAKNTSKLAGAAAGIPGVSQVWATGEHLFDVMENGEEFTVRELLFGPKRD